MEATGVPADPSAVHTYDYGYDSAGNPTRVSIDGKTSRTMAYKGTSDELASSNGLQAATGYGYDAAGNLTSSTAGYAATVEAANITTSMTDPAGGNAPTATYAGAGQNQRSTTGTGGPYGSTETATYSPLGLMGVSGVGRFTRLPNGGMLGMRPDTTVTHNRYYLTDQVGSTIAMIGADGSSTKLAAYAYAYPYEPYGGTTYTAGTAAAANPYRNRSVRFPRGCRPCGPVGTPATSPVCWRTPACSGGSSRSAPNAPPRSSPPPPERPSTQWIPAIGMDDRELAVIDYLPGAWPEGVVCIARRTRIPADRIPTERARKRRTVPKDQLALALQGRLDYVFGYSFILTNLPVGSQEQLAEVEWW